MSTRHESLPIPNLQDYAFGERLGAGSYGTVYKARLIANITSRPSSAACSRPISARPPSALPSFYAIKCIYRKSLTTKTTEDLLINEIKLLKQIKHENIVEMYDFQWDENYIYIVTEYCAGGDMSMFIRSRQQLSEARARPFVQQMAKALKFLYEKNISHMDLKPENILLTSIDKPILKIADFGVAQHIGKQGSQSIRGTLVYMAPEILLGPYDNRVDLWSIGVILYECLFGRPPFTFLTIDELISKIKATFPIEIPNDSRISPECRNLLEGLLQRDPNKRINFPDFFRHPFIFNNLSSQVVRADEFLQKAINYEQSGDLKKSLDYRVRSLDEYAAIIKVDEDIDRRRILKTKINQGITAAEALKKRISQTITNSGLTPQTTISTLPSPTMVPHADLDLNNDKELNSAYQHCLNGNQLMNQFIFAQACEEYEIGLNVMLRVARSETDPMKIKILRDVISHYLTKAELCKQRSETQRLDLAIEKIKEDNAGDTIIIDELNHEEKKQHSSSHPSCRQQ